MTRYNRIRYHAGRQYSRGLLSGVLSLIEQADQAQDYAERNKWIYHALSMAVSQGLEAGIRIDPEAPEWPVVFIELPTGQVSWHVPQHPQVWDGHTREVKYERVHTYAKNYV